MNAIFLYSVYVVMTFSFERKLKENESKRLESIAKIESEVYSSKEFKARPAPKFVQSIITPTPLLAPAAVAMRPNTRSMPETQVIAENWSSRPDISCVVQSVASSQQSLSSVAVPKQTKLQETQAMEEKQPRATQSMTANTISNTTTASAPAAGTGAAAVRAGGAYSSDTVEVAAAKVPTIAPESRRDSKTKSTGKKSKKKGKKMSRTSDDEDNGDDAGFDLADDFDDEIGFQVDEKFLDLIKF